MRIDKNQIRKIYERFCMRITILARKANKSLFLKYVPLEYIFIIKTG